MDFSPSASESSDSVLLRAQSRNGDLPSGAREAGTTLLFDRATGTLAGATPGERLAIQAFQAGARVSAPWGYRGFGLGCRLLRPMAPGGAIAVRLNEDAVFSFPFGDGYWSLLLDRHYTYERDIERFFRGISQADYTLIDCGANYGYWSVLASSSPYGAHRCIAIEPSSRNFARLAINAAINGDRFMRLRRAVSSAPGVAHLSGHKHEALSITGAGREAGEDVTVMTLDQLIDQAIVPATGRYVIKLDVEGVEIEAMAGGRRLLQSDCVVICEEHGGDRDHTVSRHLVENSPFKLFCFDPATRRFERLDDLRMLDRIKRFANFGYNVLATASSYWEQRIEGLNRA
jgi:FkbM family methyltransferase